MIRELTSVPDPAEALRRWGDLPHCLLLESQRNLLSANGEPLGRYSFLMADPIDWIECQDASACLAALKQLDQRLQQYETPQVEGLPPMQGGLAGMVSYDFHRALESIPVPAADRLQTPLLAFGVYDVVLAWDHQQQRAWLITQAWRNAAQRHQKFFDLLQTAAAPQPFASANQSSDASGSRINLPGFASLPGREGVLSNFTQESYLAAVQQAIDSIHAGDIFQVNLAQTLLVAAQTSSLDLYGKLRQCNPAPFGGYFDFGDGQIVSASPERFVSVRDDLIETRPIKGTRLRSGLPSVDRGTKAELLASEKDRAENIMIVDLMRNDLSRICHDDSVRVTQLCQLEEYQSVMHLVSAVEGRLQTGGNLPGTLLPAIFPAGSITGAPKCRSMEIISELEPDARGAYCGSLGYFAAGGAVDLNVMIRTITAAKGWWQIPVGGGIVSESVPRREYQETWTKAASMLEAVETVSGSCVN